MPSFIKKTIKVGNSAGVLLPKNLLGSEVKVTVIKRPVNIKKKVLKVLEKELDEIWGIYIINREPIEVIAISTNLRKVLHNEKIKISIVPLEIIKKDVRTKQVLRDKIEKAEVILNKSILSELKKEIRS